MSPDLPDASLSLAGLTRRQAAVWEHDVDLALSQLQRDLDAASADTDRHLRPLASPAIRAEAAVRAREIRAEMAARNLLLARLRAIRTAPLTADERARLEAARAVRELSSAEADLVIYGMLEAADMARKEAA